MPRAPTDRGRLWFIGIAVFMLSVAVFVRPALLPEIGTAFGMSATQLGLIGTFFAVGRIITDIPAGRLTDRVPAGRMMMVAALMTFLASGLFAASWTAAITYVAALVAGFGSAWTNTTGMAFFSTATGKDRRGVALSGFAAALLSGQALGPAFGGAVAALGGWRLAFVAAGGLALLSIGASMRASHGPEGQAEINADPGESTSLPRRVLLVLYALPALQMFIGGAMNQTLYPLIGDSELGLGVGAIGLGLGLGGIARLIGALSGGQIADRVSRRWALIPGLVIQISGLLVIMIEPTVATWLLAIFMTSLGSVGMSVGATILADLSGTAGLGKRLGVFRLAGDVALLIGPFLTGLLLDVSGRVAAAVPATAIAVCVTIAAAALLPETKPRWETAASGPGSV